MNNEEAEPLNEVATVEDEDLALVDEVQRPRKITRAFAATYRGLHKASGILALVGFLLGAGALALSWAPASNYRATDPAHDGYVQPRSISNLVERIQESTVTVWCETAPETGSQGTGWAIKLKTDVQEKYPTTLLTNHHVIKTCLNGGGKVTVALPYKDPKPAVIVKWDKENDLAVLATKVKLPVLQLSEYVPWPGYWVMALGSADGYEGSVSFGNVLNTNATEVLLTNNISHGNSGGPLVDNEGNVVGVVTWGLDTEQYNGAKSLDAFCVKILKCKYDKGESWWDYSG